jgi:hypothetical protein
MANTTSVQVIADDRLHAILKLTCVSDGTAETRVKKVDITTLVGYQAGASIAVRRVAWSSGNDTGYAELLWEGSSGANDRTIVTMAGGGEGDFDLTDLGTIKNNAVSPTGSILLTTHGFAATSHYTVIIECRKSGFTSREVTDSGVAS